MKIIIVMLFFSLLMHNSFSQWGYGFINFEDSSELYRIEIDTSIANNIWQIGTPSKFYFNSSHSIPNAIVTDTLYPYPANNNSIFYYRTSGDYDLFAHGVVTEFWFKMDCDTIDDFGKVEISYDDGITWENLLTGFNAWHVYDSLNHLIQSYATSNDTIVFTGKSNGWYKFSSDFSLPGSMLDSIIYRFSFHSTTPISERDGWMIDDIEYYTWWESVGELKDSEQIYPNPVKNQLSINLNYVVVYFEIMNSHGHIVKKGNNNKSPLIIDASDLPTGLYLFTTRLENNQIRYSKFIKL
jgi:hypothetical protein